MGRKKNNADIIELFDEVKSNFLEYDPAHYIKNNLTLDGEPFSVTDNGWKFMADVYRYIALEATRKNGKPVVMCKGRQVGATVMAAALDLYFTNSGLFVKPPIRIAHFFPTMVLTKRFSQSKLEDLIRTARGDRINMNKLIHTDQNAVDNITMKQFKTGTLWIENIGVDGDRVRGMTLDGAFFDECFPYHQFIETIDGKMKIGKIYREFKKGKSLPLVKTFNEETGVFEYKKITNVWKRDKSDLIEITCGKRKVKCTGNHRFLTSKGWVRAEDMSIGTLIKTSPYTKLRVRALNNDQYQMVLGSFLGDGHVDYFGLKRSRLSIIHGKKQKKYCKFKAKVFNSKIEKVKENGYAKKIAYRFSTKSFAIENELPRTKTVCPQWVLDDLDERGLAIWFMDDGSVQKWGTGASAILSTCSFDEDSQNRIVNKLLDFGISSKYYEHYKNEKKYFSIYIGKEGYDILSSLIEPYVHKSMAYKISDNKNVGTYEWDNSFEVYGYEIVTSLKNIDKKEFVYDIEVEDNHNFIATTTASSPNLGGLIAHNCQDMSGFAIGNAIKTLTASKYGPIGKGVQVYFGTPKQKGSDFYKMWQASDQRYYHLGCKNCKETFPFYLSGDQEMWKEIWISGYTIKCPLCGTEQHKVDAIEHGKWVPTRNTDECKFVGFHINQLYIPYFTKEAIEEEMPENNPTKLTRVWYNEIVGEFYSGHGVPLTKADIYENALDLDRAFSKRLDPNTTSSYFGVDWGGKIEKDDVNRGQSFSCVVVLSAQKDGTLLIEHAHKLTKHSFNYKKENISEVYRRFGCTRGVSDWFFGQDIVYDLQRMYHDRFLGAQGSAALLKPLRFREDELMITYNKNLLIEEVFNLIKRGHIRFPGKSFDRIDWLIDHCTSMDSDTKVAGGQQIKTYKKGTGPNDGLMALLYAYIAYKFDLTKGFTIKPGQKTVDSLPRPVLAHVPRLKLGGGK